MNRRQFLSALGLTGSALALGSLPRRALAQEGGVPKRLILISTGHGTVYDGWKIRPPGLDASMPFQVPLHDLTLPRALEPLDAFRDKVAVFDGLSMISAEQDIPGYRHEKGWVHAWTGAWSQLTGSDLHASMPSLDQVVARQIARADRLTSLELTVGFGRPTSHAGAGQPLPLEGDPRRVFNRLYGLAGDPTVAARRSVLDFAGAEFDALAPRLSAADRTRMGDHFDLVRQIEARIEGLASIQCAPDGTVLPGNEGEYDAVFRAQADLLANAFACDLTRVGTLSLGDIPSRDFGWGDYLSGDAHNDFAHRIYVDPQAASAMTDYHRFHSAQVAYLLELLDAIPEGNGTLLDNTVVVWGSELADGWHGYKHWFGMVAGGGWRFNLGNAYVWPYGQQPWEVLTPEGWSRTGGLPHQQLLVSVARAMGLDTDTVGLSELVAPDGSRVDIRGEIEELLIGGVR